MFEYDDDLKVSLLKNWNFDLDSIDVNKVAHVPMHQYRISTEEKPMLFVENLQCCIALYAILENGVFAAHINPVILRGDEFETRYGRVIRCKRIDDLKDFIIKYNPSKVNFSIGVMVGSRPLPDSDGNMQIFYDNLDELLWELKLLGYSNVEILKNTAPEFIVSAENGEIILPKPEEQKIR